jgi:hypothetical protein
MYSHSISSVRTIYTLHHLACPTSKYQLHELWCGEHRGHNPLVIVLSPETLSKQCKDLLFCELLHHLAEKSTGSLIIIKMIKTWSQNVRNIQGHKGTNNPGCTHSIPHTNLIYHVMAFGELTCNFLLFWEFTYPLEWNQALLPKRMRVGSICPSYTIWRYQLCNSILTTICSYCIVCEP